MKYTNQADEEPCTTKSLCNIGTPCITFHQLFIYHQFILFLLFHVQNVSKLLNVLYIPCSIIRGPLLFSLVDVICLKSIYGPFHNYVWCGAWDVWSKRSKMYQKSRERWYHDDEDKVRIAKTLFFAFGCDSCDATSTQNLKYCFWGKILRSVPSSILGWQI